MEYFQALLWVDIVQGKLFIYDPETEKNDMVRNYWNAAQWLTLWLTSNG